MVVFNEPKKAHVTSFFIRLHWLPVAARIKFKVLMCANKTTTGAAPIYLNSLVQTYAPYRRLYALWCHPKVPNHSRAFSWTVHSCWNDLPISIQTVFSRFQKPTKDTSFPPAPDQLILTLTYSVLNNNPSYVYCARLTETCHGTCILLLSRWSDCFFYSPHLYVALDKSIC